MRRHLVPSGSVQVTTTLTRAIVLAGRKPGKDRRAAWRVAHNSPVTGIFCVSSTDHAACRQGPVGRHGITIKESWDMRRLE